MNLFSRRIRRVLLLTVCTLCIMSISVCASSGDKLNVASFGEEEFATLADAILAVETSGEIKMISDVEIEGTVVIPKEKDITLNLNGKVISAVDIQIDKSYELIKNQGKLTVEDSVGTGKITLSATTDRDWNCYSSVIANHQGTVVVNGGTIEHTGGTDMAYAIDNLTNSGIGKAELTINDGKLTSTYRAIRQFGNCIVHENKLTINGGEIISTTSNRGAVWLTSANKKKNLLTLNINEGTVSAVYIYATAGGDATGIRINIDEDCVTSEVTYGNIEARIGEVYYGTLEKAILAAEENDLIDILGLNVSVEGEYTIPNSIKITNGDLTIIDTTTLSGDDVTITFEDVNIDNQSTVDVGEVNVKILNGHFTFNPAKYLEDGKAAIPSTETGYLFTVGEKLVDIDTQVEAGVPSVEVPEGMEIESEDFEIDKNVLESLASSLANDSEIVGKLEDIFDTLSGDVSDDINSGDIIVVIKPYIDVKIESGDSTSLVLEIDLKYDIIAKVNGDDNTVTSGNADDSNAVILSSNNKFDIDKEIEITIPLPTGFAEDIETLFVHHKKGRKTYIYKTEIANDKRTLKFKNPHGFSPFEVTSEGGAVINETTNTRYISLEEAISEVNNGDVIKLLADNNEEIIIRKEIKFSIDRDEYTFSGDIKAGPFTTKTETEDETVIVYEFDDIYKNQSTGGSSSKTTTYRISVTAGDNGSISPKGSIYVKKGRDQSFEIKADEGYEISDVIVDGKSVGTVEEYTFENVREKHTITVEFKKIEDEEEKVWVNPFEDVNENNWFYNAVKFANENKLFNGVSNMEFGTNLSMTRAMIVTVLYRLNGEPATNKSIPFADVDMSMYYANAVIWAKQNNIVNGIDETDFAPNVEVTREQLVTILYRYAKFVGMDVSVGEETNILSYEDFNEISEYSIEAFQWACGSEIIAGRTKSTLAPKGTATRAEVATMLMRFCK